MDIKKAVVGDASAISRIYAASWKAAYAGIVPQKYLDELADSFWISFFENGIGNGTVSALLVYDGAVPIGCAAFGKSRDEKLPEWGEIISLYLLPGYFGKGYGKLLLQTVLAEMKFLGFNDVYLWVLEQNSRARRFYEKNGFAPTNDKYLLEIMGKALYDIRYTFCLSVVRF